MSVSHELSLAEEVKAAYTYAYPLVLMDITCKVSTNVASATEVSGKAPINQFSLSQYFVTPEQKEVVRPNADTLYCLAWLDLGPEPLVMTVGAMDIYYMLPILNGWTNVFTPDGSPNAIGAASGNKRATNWVLCGPNFKGDIPAGLQRLDLATEMAWILGRIECHGDVGGPADPYSYQSVHQLQSSLHLIPLSSWDGDPDSYQAPPGVVDPALDMSTPPPQQVADLTNIDCSAFFTRFCALMHANPPDPESPAMESILQRLGLTPGAQIDWRASMSEQDFATAQAAAQAALAAICDPKSALEARPGPTPAREMDPAQNNYWTMITNAKMGDFGRHYFFRAVVAEYGLGANLVADAIYPSCSLDSNGESMLNNQTYTITFPPGQTPPAKGFWSITVYDAEGYFIPNAMRRYSYHNWDNPTPDAEGNVVITLCLLEEGRDYSGMNILPLGNAGDAPASFNLTMRMYWPDVATIDAGWMPPAVCKV
ncbi:DUF1254 domain-containing protein [Massilia sp. W12]|uniref:DUF1254 domain-containing protein n=1 Tax=Massilia sp. W12 TaxID=3126507 RepID=UPI0030D5C531